TVGAGTPQHQQITCFWQFQRSIAKEEVPWLADGADDVCFGDVRASVAAANYRRVGVYSLVERGANEIVHGSIYYDENFVAIAFDVLNAHKQNACGADDGAAGLQQQAASERADVRKDCAGVGLQVGRTFARVANADAASQIQIR